MQIQQVCVWAVEYREAICVFELIYMQMLLSRHCVNPCCNTVDYLKQIIEIIQISLVNRLIM